MTKKDAIKSFKEGIIIGGNLFENVTDNVAIRTAWNDFVDYLQKDGRVTEKQAMTWNNPFCK